MIKRFIVINLMLLFSTNQCFPQFENFNVGTVIGTGISNFHYNHKVYINNQLNSSIVDYWPTKFGLLGGFLFNIKINKHFSFHSETLLEDKGGIWHGQDNYFSKVYIHFPEMIRLLLPIRENSNDHIFIETGPYFSYLIYTYYHGDKGLRKDNQRSGEIDYGIVTGIGYSWVFKIGRFDLELKYENTIFPKKVTYSDIWDGSAVTIVDQEVHRMLNLSTCYYLPVRSLKWKTRTK